MVLKSFERLIASEAAAARELRRQRFDGGRTRCPACTRRPCYLLAEGRYRCGKCRYTFAVTTGTWLGRCRLAARTWLWVAKLFELETTARVAARQTGLSYPTALRAFTTIRRALMAAGADPDATELLRAEVEADESYFGPRGPRGGKRGRGSPRKIPVFGLLERGGRVSVTVLPDISARTLVDETVKVVKRGALLYTDKYRGYDTLMCCGYRHLRVDHGRPAGTPGRFARGKVHINGLEGFWSFAKGKLYKYHGVSPEKFPLYLYEMQFRYNHRDEDLFRLILHALSRPVPDL